MNVNLPGRATISNRSSTISSQFARARAPYVQPAAEEMLARYRLLQIDPNNPTCAYCGSGQTEWDHLHALVSGARWTGYYTEIANLIPSCGKCNQSRGSRPYANWMRGAAVQSPTSVFRVRDGLSLAGARAEIERRIAIIDKAVIAQPPHRIDVGASKKEEELEQLRLQILALLPRAQAIAAELAAEYSMLAVRTLA